MSSGITSSSPSSSVLSDSDGVSLGNYTLPLYTNQPVENSAYQLQQVQLQSQQWDQIVSSTSSVAVPPPMPSASATIAALSQPEAGDGQSFGPNRSPHRKAAVALQALSDPSSGSQHGTMMTISSSTSTSARRILNYPQAGPIQRNGLSILPPPTSSNFSSSPSFGGGRPSQPPQPQHPQQQPPNLGRSYGYTSGGIANDAAWNPFPMARPQSAADYVFLAKSNADADARKRHWSELISDGDLVHHASYDQTPRGGAAFLPNLIGSGDSSQSSSWYPQQQQVINGGGSGSSTRSAGTPTSARSLSSTSTSSSMSGAFSPSLASSMNTYTSSSMSGASSLGPPFITNSGSVFISPPQQQQQQQQQQQSFSSYYPPPSSLQQHQFPSASPVFAIPQSRRVSSGYANSSSGHTNGSSGYTHSSSGYSNSATTTNSNRASPPHLQQPLPTGNIRGGSGLSRMPSSSSNSSASMTHSQHGPLVPYVGTMPQNSHYPFGQGHRPHHHLPYGRYPVNVIHTRAGSPDLSYEAPSWRPHEEYFHQRTRVVIQQYMTIGDNACDVTFVYPRVAQKSYGNEKRFLCPPPAVQLHGRFWSFSDNHGVSVSLLTDDCIDPQEMPFDATGRAIFKQVFVSDAEKRKSFQLHIKISVNDHVIGIFQSDPIKIVSKPSKKKQSTKNFELCVRSGSSVSLFNRLRSQTGSTKFLSTERDTFAPKPTCWDTFVITSQGHEEDLLRYGMDVVLQSNVSGISSALCVLRKVERSQHILSPDEPVSQLHKVALQVKGTSDMFLCLVNDMVVTHKVNIEEQTPAPGKIYETYLENASWTMVGTEYIPFTFCVLDWPVILPVSPFPLINVVKTHSKIQVELIGSNLSNNLIVWFGLTPSHNILNSPERIMCRPPSYTEIVTDFFPNNPNPPKRVNVNIVLVRSDGVIYPTPHEFTYTTDE